MRQDEAWLLGEWSQGRQGASPRLARRAWTVLADAAGSDPYRLSQAIGSAADASKWIRAFHAQGALGLLDAPRTGRPGHRRDEILAVHQRVVMGAPDARLGVLVRGLSMPQREALWRLNRASGHHVERKTGWLDIRLAVPPNLDRLIGLLLLPGFSAIVTHTGDAVDVPGFGHWLTTRDAWRGSRGGPSRLPTRPSLDAVIGHFLDELAPSLNEPRGTRTTPLMMRRHVRRVQDVSRALGCTATWHLLPRSDEGEQHLAFLKVLRGEMGASRGATDAMPVAVRWIPDVAALPGILQTALGAKRAEDGVQRLAGALAHSGTDRLSWVRAGPEGLVDGDDGHKDADSPSWTE